MQLKPLSIQAAAKMVPSNSIPLVLNTPYTLFKSRDDQLLKEPTFIPMDEAKNIFNIHQQVSSDSLFNKKNVVLIIMESFSYEYISFYHPEKNRDSILGFANESKRFMAKLFCQCKAID
ncbi:MAG: hypothetical protein IPJ26_19420 [Bacteroidetes bacterium]|nr:hypothetical protein [Bacteroidota bacterium]